MLRNRKEKVAKGSLFLPVAKARTNNFLYFPTMYVHCLYNSLLFKISEFMYEINYRYLI